MSESSCNQGDGSLCNLEYLLVNLGRNHASAERLIRLFLDICPALCERLQEAARQGDREALKVALHEIRGSCVLFSGHQCVELARQFEQSLRDEASGTNTGEWVSMAASLSNCLHCMATELRCHLERGG